MELQQLLLKEGREAGMCEEFRDELRTGTKSVEELCALYHRGLDFCIEKKFPSLEFIKEHFDRDEIKRYGIFIANGISENQSNVVALGNASVSVRVKNYGCCDVTVMDSARVSINLGIGAFCYVSLHDNSSVLVARKADDSRLYASVFSPSCEINNKDMFKDIHIKYKEE